MTRTQMQKRFRKLVVKEALSKASAIETHKLNRYQKLLSPKVTPSERAFQSLLDYKMRLYRKIIGAGLRQLPPPQKAIDLLNANFWQLI